MKALRVLDGEVVQAERVLYARELLGGGLDHAEPDEAGVVLADRRGLLGVHLAGVLPAAVAVMRAVDDRHGRAKSSSAT